MLSASIQKYTFWPQHLISLFINPSLKFLTHFPFTQSLSHSDLRIPGREMKCVVCKSFSTLSHYFYFCSSTILKFYILLTSIVLCKSKWTPNIKKTFIKTNYNHSQKPSSSRNKKYQFKIKMCKSSEPLHLIFGDDSFWAHYVDQSFSIIFLRSFNFWPFFLAKLPQLFDITWASCISCLL